MTTSVPQSPRQSTESVGRVGLSPPTYVRTYGLTKNLQDQGGSLTFLNAHDNDTESAAGVGHG